MINRRSIMLCLIFTVVIAFSSNFNFLYSETGSIRGIVSSTDGLRIPNVTVLIEGKNLSVKTDNTGHYELPGLEPGTYRLIFSYLDFPVKHKTVTVESGHTIEVNVTVDLSRLKPYEVLVTARKHVESFREVPVSMAVYPDFKLEQSGIEDVSDIFLATHGLHRAGAQFDNVNIIRGISSFENALYSPAGVFIDGVALPVQLMQNPGLLDVQRVEVLKGPQGTLYGRNTESGLVNIITRQPGNQWNGKLFGGYGSYRSFEAGATLEGILVPDKLFFRTAIQGARSDGYVENLFTGSKKSDGFEKRYSGRGTLRWTPSSHWDISLSVAGNRSNDGIGQMRFVDEMAGTGRHQINYNTENYRHTDGDYQILRIGYHNQSIDVLSISSRHRYDMDGGGDVDLSPIDLGQPLYNYENQTYSQEIRINPSDTGKSLWWQLGAYAYHESLDVTTDWLNVPVTFGGGKKADTETRHSGFALFGQLRITLGKRFHVTTGLRLDSQKSSGDYVENGMGEISEVDTDFHHLELLPKVSLAYDFSPDAMGYVSVSRGFLAGGFKHFDVEDALSFSYDPEFTWNYEAGIKAAFFEKRLFLNAALFYIDIKDKQVFEFNPRTFENDVKNAADAHSMGVELDLEARPVKGLTLSAGLALMESQYDHWVTSEFDWGSGSLVEVVYDGYKFQDAPDYTFHVSAYYSHSSGFFGGLEVIGVGKVMGNIKNTIQRDPYQLVNASIGYRYKNMKVTLWCKNLLDTEFIIQSYEWGDMVAVRDGEPVRFGVTWSFMF